MIGLQAVAVNVIEERHPVHERVRGGAGSATNRAVIGVVSGAGEVSAMTIGVL